MHKLWLVLGIFWAIVMTTVVMATGFYRLYSVAPVLPEETIAQRAQNCGALDAAFQQNLEKVFGHDKVIIRDGGILIGIGQQFGNSTQTQIADMLLATGLKALINNPYRDRYGVAIWGEGGIRETIVTRADHPKPETELAEVLKRI